MNKLLNDAKDELKWATRNNPELRRICARAEAYWLPSIEGALDEGGGSQSIMVSMDDTIKELKEYAQNE